MKFLPQEMVTPNIIPLNFIYDKGTEFGNDTLTIIFKDNVSGMKSSYTIKQPVIEAYFVKPEYRTFDGDLSHHWIGIDKCYKKIVPYATRFYEAAKELGLDNSEQAKLNPYVYGLDIEVENWYLIQFVKEYPCTEAKNINCGYFDIENDIIRIDHFPEYGETPINAVTYIDGPSKIAYTLILAKTDLPVVGESHPMYAAYEDMRENWTKELDEIRNDIPKFIQSIHSDFDEKYPGFEYYLAFFDDEITLIQTFWDIVKECNNDFVYAWNLPYDAQNMMSRPGILGYNVNEIIPDPKVMKDENSMVSFTEDKNAKVAKRKHQCITWTLPTFLDQMVMYAGIRSGRGELASTKLNYIAEIELKDSKLDYSEDGNIKTLFYRNLYKFIKYNLKDVLLQYSIESKTLDIQTIYSRMYDLFVTPSQSFTTTKVVLHALYAYALGKGFILGHNRNKNHKNLVLPKYGELFSNVTVDTTEEEYFDVLFGEDEESNEENEDGTVKREKYAGAFVMNPLYISPTGVMIRGKPSKYVHDEVVDEDITSEYPSAIMIGNISSETLVGRVFLEGDLPTIPIPEMFEFRGDEAAKYKMDVSNFMLEQYSERDYISFCHNFLNLPTFNEICEQIEKGII